QLQERAAPRQRAAGRDSPRHAHLGEMAYQVLRAWQRTHVAQLSGEQARVRLFKFGRVFLAQVMPRLARQTLREQSTAHPDAPMNAPDRQLDVAQLERLVPGDGVLVD